MCGDNPCWEVEVVAQGCTRLYHRSRYENRELVSSDILVQVLIVSIFREVVLFLEFEFGQLLSSCAWWISLGLVVFIPVDVFPLI